MTAFFLSRRDTGLSLCVSCPGVQEYRLLSQHEFASAGMAPYQMPIYWNVKGDKVIRSNGDASNSASVCVSRCTINLFLIGEIAGFANCSPSLKPATFQ